MKKDDREFKDFFDGIGKEFLDSFVVAKEIDEPTQGIDETLDSGSPILSNHANEVTKLHELRINDSVNSGGDSLEKHDTTAFEAPVRCKLDSEAIDRITLKLNENNKCDGVTDSAFNNCDVKEIGDSVRVSEDENNFKEIGIIDTFTDDIVPLNANEYKALDEPRINGEETEAQETVDNTKDEFLSLYINTEENLQDNMLQSEVPVEEKIDNNIDEMLSSFVGVEALSQDHISDSSKEERSEGTETSSLERTTDDIIAELLGIKKVSKGTDGNEAEEDVAEDNLEEPLPDTTGGVDSISAKSVNEELIEVVVPQEELIEATDSHEGAFVVENHKKTENTADDIIATLLGFKKESEGNDSSETEIEVAEINSEEPLHDATDEVDLPSTKSAYAERTEAMVPSKDPIESADSHVEAFVVEKQNNADNTADDIIAKLLIGNTPVESSKKTESKTEPIDITAPIKHEKSANDIIASMMGKSDNSKLEDNSDDKSRKNEDAPINTNSYENETAINEKKGPSTKAIFAVIIVILLVVIGVMKILNLGNNRFDDLDDFYDYDTTGEYEEEYDGEDDSIIRAYLDEYDSDSVLQALYYVDEDGYVLTDKPDSYTSTTGECPRYLQCPVYDFEDGYAYIDTPANWGWIDEAALQPIESPNLYDCVEINEYGCLTDFRDSGISVHPEPRKNSVTIYSIFKDDIFKVLYICDADDTSFAFIKYVDSIGQVSYGWLNMAYAEIKY